MTISALTGRAKKIAWNILPRRTTIRLYARNIAAIAHSYDWRGNLPVWMALSAQWVGMILFILAVKYVWGELRNYESICKQADLSEAARQRYAQLAFVDLRKNPSPQNAVKHRRHRRGAMMIKQSDPADSDDQETDVIHAPPAPGSLDTDGDGLYDVEEEALGTDWRRPDTDGDGLNDERELKMGLDPASYDSINSNAGNDNHEGNGDSSIRFGTFSYPSSGSRQKWNSLPKRTKRGRKR